MMAKMIYANRLRHSLRVEMAREIERSEGRESVMSVFDCVVCSRHTLYARAFCVSATSDSPCCLFYNVLICTVHFVLFFCLISSYCSAGPSGPFYFSIPFSG